MEHEERADRLEREADRMEEEAERVGEEIDDTKREWDAKKEDPAVPGAQPADGEERSLPGVESDPKLLDEEGGP